MTLDHFLLDGVELAGAGDPFHRDDFAPGHEANRHEATVDGAIARLALGIPVNDRHRARAAIPLGAAFFGAGQPRATEVFEQGGIGGAVREADSLTVERKLDAFAHNGCNA